jgi:hypothetical protein
MSESRYTDLITQRRAEKRKTERKKEKKERTSPQRKKRERDCGTAFALVLGPRYANEWSLSLSLLSSPPSFCKTTHTQGSSLSVAKEKKKNRTR